MNFDFLSLSSRIALIAFITLTLLHQSESSAQQPAIPSNAALVVERPLSEIGDVSVHCGLFSLLAASHSLDQPIPKSDLFVGNYIENNLGSTATNLLTAAKDFGLNAKSVQDWPLACLKSLDCPAILQLNVGRNSDSYHWVLYNGCDRENNCLIFDAPHDEKPWSDKEIEASWTGNAVVLWNSGEAPQFRLIEYLIYLNKLTWTVVPILACLILSLVGSRFNLRENAIGLKSIAARSTVVVAIVTLWSVAIFLVNPERLNNSSHITEVSCWSSAGTGFTGSYTRELDNDLLFDCRTAWDFKASHIEGAISLPVNIGMQHWKQTVEQQIKDSDPKKIVVYCQSAGCMWADETCRRLACLGIDASVYVGGYQRYENEKNFISEPLANDDGNNH